MHSWIELNAENLRHNFRLLQTSANPSLVIPIIKSNAYGHGLKQVYTILKEEKLDILGVNYLHEAEILRDLGYAGRILCVGPIFNYQMSTAYSLQTEILIENLELLKYWESSAEKPSIHFKFDTGMSRQGFYIEQMAEIWQILQFNNASHIKGICSHFSNVEDVLEQDFAMKQLDIFNQIADLFHQKGINAPLHIASSASTEILKDGLFDYVRDGISLYGLWPSKATRLSFSKLYGFTLSFKPVLSWRTKIASIKHVPKNSYIGYGCTYKALKDMTIAIIPVGYNEGYPRLNGERNGYVLIHGARCPIVGRICMNMFMADISHVVTPTKIEDLVTLIGSDQTEDIEAESFASWSNTIHYEALTRINPTIPRVIV